MWCAAPKIYAVRLYGKAAGPRVQDELHLDAAHRLKGVADLDVEAAKVFWDCGSPLGIRGVVGCLRRGCTLSKGEQVRVHWAHASSRVTHHGKKNVTLAGSLALQDARDGRIADAVVGA